MRDASERFGEMAPRGLPSETRLRSRNCLHVSVGRFVCLLSNEPLGPQHPQLPDSGIRNDIRPLRYRAWCDAENGGQRCGGSGLLDGE